MPDEAWALEQEFWRAASTGDADGYYRRYMTADGFVVAPGAVFDRQELIARGQTHESLDGFELSEPRILVVDGESVLLSYTVHAKRPTLGDYRAIVTALYIWEGSGWALAFRQHTPDPNEPFPF